MAQRSRPRGRRGRHFSRVIAATVAAAALSAATPDASLAASYKYCDGCTINSGQWRISNATRYAIRSYVHRLSGPSGSVYIEAAAITTTGLPVCTKASYSTEVWCDPGGQIPVHGGAYNGGAGNYGFNAHLTY